MYVESARKIKDEFKLEHPEYRYARSTREQPHSPEPTLQAPPSPLLLPFPRLDTPSPPIPRPHPLHAGRDLLAGTKKRKQQQSAAIAQAAAAMHAVPSREPDTAPMSLHALALAGASLAATSPRADAAPKGYFTHMGVAARPSPMSGGGGGEEEAEGGGPSEPAPAPSPRPPSAPAQDAAMGSRSSSFSMLDQLCHVADGVKRAA